MLTNTWQPTAHLSQKPGKIVTSLTSPSHLRSSLLHVQTTVVRSLATPHLQGEFTSWEDAQGLHTETPHTARVRELSFPQHSPAQLILQPKVAGKHGGIFPRGAHDLRTSLTDESVLVRPTVAQKPEAGSPVKSATGIDMTPSQHRHPTIQEHACMVRHLSFAGALLRSGVWLLSSPSPSLPLPPSRSDSLSLLLSLPSFLPPPPHRRLQPPSLCNADVRSCMWFTNIPSVSCYLGRACSSRCLSICVACQMPHPDMAG